MSLDFRTAPAALRLAAIAAVLSAAPVYAACTPTGALVHIPATTTVNGVNDAFTGLAFSIDGAIDGDGLFFKNAAPNDALTILNHGPVDSTTGPAGNEGIFVEGEFGDICYDGDAAATITSASDGLSIYQQGDGGVLLDIAHTIDAHGSAVLVTHQGKGNVDIHTTAGMNGRDAGIAVDHAGTSGNIDITTTSGTTIVATGGDSPLLGAPGGIGIVASRESFPAGGSGNINVDNGADIVADSAGIATSMCGCVGGTTTIRSTGDITSQVGIIAFSDSDVIVNVQGGTIAGDTGVVAFGDRVDVTLGAGAKIHLNHPSLAFVDIGIFVDAAGEVHTTVAGSVEAATGARAIDLRSDSDITLTLEPGYSIIGYVDAFPQQAGSTSTLDFGGNTGTAAFNLDSIGSTPADQYLGFDTFEKTGTSIWSFTGDTFTGTLDVKAGTAKINDAISSLDILLSGGTVGGNGSFHSLTGTGTIAPGNSIGTLTVLGNAAIGAGSVLDIELNAAGASDLLDVGGAATIASTASVIAHPAAGTYGGITKYTILTAATGVTGAFSGVTSVSAFFDPTLSYDANHVFLTLTRNTTSLTSLGLTPNQKAAAGVLDAFGPHGAPYLDELVTLTAPEIPGALDQLSGDGYASVLTALIDDDRYLRDAVLDHLLSAGNAPGVVTATGYAEDAATGPAPTGSTAWAHAYGGLTSLPGNGNGPGLEALTGGLVIGADRGFGDGNIGGLAASGLSHFALPSRNMTGDSANITGGIYGRGDWDNFYLSFGTTFTHHAVSTTRTVTVGGASDIYTANYTAVTAQAFGEAGVTIDLGATSITPFAGVTAVGAHATGFTENGAGPGPLTVGPASASALIVDLGLRVEHQFVLHEDMLVTLAGSAAWRHAFGNVATTQNIFPGSAPFTVAGTSSPADALLLTASADLDVSEALAIRAAFSGVLSAAGASHALTATLTGKF